MATTTLTGTTGNDILNAPGSVTTLVAGLEGNDTITLQLAGDEANAGSGADLITLAQSVTANSTISAGEGNDTLALNTSVTIFGGSFGGNDGDDVITLTAAQLNNGTLGGNKGNDTIRVEANATNALIGGGANHDSLSLVAGTITNSTVFGGGGKDTLNLNGGTITLSTVNSGDGHDRVALTGATVTNTVIALGKGLDSITLGSQATVTVSGGGQNDTISFNSAVIFGGGVIYGDGNGETAAGANAGNDLIGGTGTQLRATTIYGAGGDDTINFLSASTGLLIDGGNGADLIGHTASILNFSQSTINGGAGADTIKLSNVVNGAQLLGGDGNDSLAFLTINGGAASINGGAGLDTITLLSGAGNTFAASTTINGGDAADKILINNTVGEASFSTVTAGAVSGYTAFEAAVQYGAGDTIVFTNTAQSTTQANWVGAGAQVSVITTLSGFYTAVNSASTEAGSVSVFSDGTDTYFFVNDTSTVVSAFVVLGADLVTTTSTGNSNLSSANFGFSIAANTSGTGVAITLI